MISSVFCSPGVNDLKSLLLKLRSRNLVSYLHFERSSDLLFRSWVGCLNARMEGFPERQSKHRLLVLM